MGTISTEKEHYVFDLGNGKYLYVCEHSGATEIDEDLHPAIEMGWINKEELKNIDAEVKPLPKAWEESFFIHFPQKECDECKYEE